MTRSSSSMGRGQMVGFGLVAAAVTFSMLWYVFKLGNLGLSIDSDDKELLLDEEDDQDNDEKNVTNSKEVKLSLDKPGIVNDAPTTSFKPNIETVTVKPVASTKDEEVKQEESKEDPKKTKQEEVHKLVEDADKRGKVLFKAKNYLEAATCFSEAIDLIDAHHISSVEEGGSSNTLARQFVTLMNNRSAMYEKGGLPDLALSDCDAILEKDVGHCKARTRKLRILEAEKRYTEALTEVCALQLKFMQDNRDKIRMGIPCKPPVSQEKIEELVTLILPKEVEETVKRNKTLHRELPSVYTILQLLQSFSGFNAWMAKAAKDENVSSLTTKLDALEDGDTGKAELLFRRGRRYMYEQRFEDASKDFEGAYDITEKNESIKDDFEEYPRLLEWVGMGRHLRYDLDRALECYEKCSDLEPTNTEILVKRAGVKMDDGKTDDANELFETALGLEPNAVDALLHRSNLRMIKQNLEGAKADLERCIELRPDFILARLRLTTILMATQDLDGAKKALDGAEAIKPDSSDVHSYRGEMLFSSGEFADAKKEFERAIECDATNPTPYVNAALSVMNIPTSFGPPDVKEAVKLLSKAIEVDPMFHAAYVHLGQLQLSMATNLNDAREVTHLYDKGIKQCRTAEELKDICSMRILTVAQVDAAASLKMDTLNMQ
eukprot:CAMPEP_0195523292 /NCGR_PEP_ID=MMETSP0794_2-20130614/22288_1 /TAXON_ID=515487 /ORGANISM="Stephanopyxis turris, Strain CCMP 815" /LENGTH=662 /DNA_ID=CAMNT_0040653259 /DNA_START=125 /DNA_END=2113 /DNA_ORIENTATION=-